MNDVTTKQLPIGVLISGRGSNLQAILDAVERGEVSARVVVVISNREGAFGLERARRHGIPTLVFPRRDFASREEQQAAVAAELLRRGVELVVLAGFDQVVGAALLESFPNAIINIHPSLLPAFGGGLHAQREALEHGVKLTGCTVHLVTQEVDAGPILLQAAVEVRDDDTEETLANRILVQEHRLLPKTIDLIARKRVRIEGRRVLSTPEYDRPRLAS